MRVIDEISGTEPDVSPTSERFFWPVVEWQQNVDLFILRCPRCLLIGDIEQPWISDLVTVEKGLSTCTAVRTAGERQVRDGLFSV
jgi:hypothetical protein